MLCFCMFFYLQINVFNIYGNMVSESRVVYFIHSTNFILFRQQFTVLQLLIVTSCCWDAQPYCHIADDLCKSCGTLI